jgi:hypothetical protein
MPILRAPVTRRVPMSEAGAWAIAEGGDPVRSAVRAAFDDTLGRVLGASPESLPRVDRVLMQAHGRLSPAARVACHIAAAREIIAPCASVLLERSLEPSMPHATHSANSSVPVWHDRCSG